MAMAEEGEVGCGGIVCNLPSSIMSSHTKAPLGLLIKRLKKRISTYDRQARRANAVK